MKMQNHFKIQLLYVMAPVATQAGTGGCVTFISWCSCSLSCSKEKESLTEFTRSVTN